jgi:hypothetical protein
MSGTYYSRLPQNLKATGHLPSAIYIFGHSPDKLRLDAGGSSADLGRFLDHSLLTVMAVYLPRIAGAGEQALASGGECQRADRSLSPFPVCTAVHWPRCRVGVLALKVSQCPTVSSPNLGWSFSFRRHRLKPSKPSTSCGYQKTARSSSTLT